MSRGWRVLDFTECRGELVTRRGQLVVIRQGHSETAVPAADVAVVLLGTRLTIGPQALPLLAKHDIAALLCDWRGVPHCALYPWLEHTRVGARQRAQAQLSRPRAKNAWMQLVAAKIRGQAAALDTAGAGGSQHLRDLAAQVRSGDPANVEATAARWYWSRIFVDSEQRFRRDHTGTDGLNAALNYGYAVVRGFGIRAAAAAGLAPSLGVFHKNRSNQFNLVEDLIEPFRPIVDAAVASQPRGVLNGPETRRNIVTILSDAPEGDTPGIAYEMLSLAQRVGTYVEGGADRLLVRHWTGHGYSRTREETR